MYFNTRGQSEISLEAYVIVRTSQESVQEIENKLYFQFTHFSLFGCSNDAQKKFLGAFGYIEKTLVLKPTTSAQCQRS